MANKSQEEPKTAPDGTISPLDLPSKMNPPTNTALYDVSYKNIKAISNIFLFLVGQFLFS